MTTITKFDVNVSTSTVNALLQKERELKIDYKTMVACMTPDYSDVVTIPQPTTFVAVQELLPAMEDNDDWFVSPTCVLLVQDSTGELSIEQGFLAKWKDDDHLFWYEDDVITNVIGWMPYPDEATRESKLSLIKKLKESRVSQTGTYWTPDLLAVKDNTQTENFLHIGQGLPPLYKETDLTIESDVVIVEYEYNTVNGIFTGLATSKLVFDKETQQLEWNDTFSFRHANSCRVSRWKKLPLDVFAQFQA
ncbi:hypothetical protein IRT38_00815 (plasmid) [Acinetobacter sp. SK-43]|uniref:hypothetical protein n=1 Tax=Acinetobacter sp. SK-43 TaxID=2785295 RepID=UPI00188AA5FE|nr:hypothetical protein [Acinetobacter sp. SK-43]MBF4453957.1 hypothetical protein [Acinetobacter sp. SK-43]